MSYEDKFFEKLKNEGVSDWEFAEFLMYCLQDMEAFCNVEDEIFTITFSTLGELISLPEGELLEDFIEKMKVEDDGLKYSDLLDEVHLNGVLNKKGNDSTVELPEDVGEVIDTIINFCKAYSNYEEIKVNQEFTDNTTTLKIEIPCKTQVMSVNYSFDGMY